VLPGFSGLVPPLAKHMQIGLIKIYARKHPEKKSSITIKMKTLTVHDEFWTEQKFIYQEIRNPVSAGVRRFIDLRTINPNKERFFLKNNLNLPLFLNRFHCDESIVQIAWTG
jgi:hypothetical protein